MDSSPRPAPSSPPDLGRLRIPREGRSGRGYRGFPWFAILVVLVLVAVAWLYRDRLLGFARTVGDPPVRTARATRVLPGRGEEGDVSANGYVFANRQASVATVLSGRLVELYAEEGDVVPAQSVMARIQYDDFEASWRAAQERVKVAEAQAEEAARAVEEMRAERPRLEAALEAQAREATLAKDNLERLDREVKRNRPLHEERLIDDGTWDRIQVEAQAARQTYAAAASREAGARAALDALGARIRRLEASTEVATLGVAAAKRDEDVARITLEKTKIRAPFEGLVIRKDAELGEVIAPTGAGNSRGSVFTIVDPSSLEVQVELSEKRIRKVREGDAASIFLDADPDTGWPGRVRKIWPRADRSKGTIELRVAFEERPEELRPEMAARVVFRGTSEEPATTEPRIEVPAEAVVRRGDEEGVFVVEGGVARFRAATVHRGEGGRMVVDKGLEGGETVVLGPSAALADGDRVRLEEDATR